MALSKQNWAVLLGLALAAILAVSLWPRKSATRVSPSPTVPPSATLPPTNLVAAPAITGLENQLRSVSVALQNHNDPQTANERLSELRRALLSVPAGDAVAAIRRFLDSKADAPTSQGFKIGAGGFLDHSPTLRVFLLDFLGRLDPAAAADYSRVVLSSMDSADEWALALRNLARGDTAGSGRVLLEQKLGDMLQYEPWRQNPSAGFLEAFDVAVYLGGTQMLPTLTGLVRKQDNRAVAHAAYLALDRLVIADAATVLDALSGDLGSMEGRELTRADYFARADVRDARQRQALEKYLLDPRLGGPELQQFTGVFPNANYMISQNLLTPTPTPDHASLTSRDAESLRVVEAWLADPRFAKLAPQLERVRQRLQEFQKQPGGK
jgi:hypothetical protein